MADREPAPDSPHRNPPAPEGNGEAGEAATEPPVAEEAPGGPGEGDADGGGIGEADIFKALGMKAPKDPKKAARKFAKALMETRKERDQALAERDEARDERLRAVAEFANSRKRLQREREEVVNHASERVAGQLLPALDAMDAALSIGFQTPAEQKMWEGLQAVRNLLLEALGREGLIPIEAAPGTAFDLAVHEAALMAEGSGEGSGEMVVDAELQRGYRFRSGRVIRNSLVSVAFAPREEPPPATPAGGEGEEPVGSGEEPEAASPVDGESAEAGEGEVPESAVPVEGEGEGAAAGAEEGSEKKAES